MIENTPTGIVIKKLGNIAFVGEGDDEFKRIYACNVRGRLKLRDRDERSLVCVGDRVKFSVTGEAEGIIEEICERKTLLARAWVMNLEVANPIVANAEDLIIVVSVNPIVKPGIIDRYLVAGLAGGLNPVIVLNKIDLKRATRERSKLDVYRRLGYPVLETSAIYGDGVKALDVRLVGRFSIFCGHSGVGKSSLLNAMHGMNLKVADVAEKTMKGKHTTAHIEMFPHPGGGAVVDTPGIRSFGVVGVHSDELIQFFPEIEETAKQCEFHDCRHTEGQTGCAILPAVEKGEIAASRWKSYLKLKAELDELEAY